MKKMLSLGKKNFLYNIFYQLLLIVVPLITTPYLSRVLGAEEIGLYSYSYAIAYYFVMFIMLGLNNYGNRTIAFVRDDRKKLSKTFCEIFTMQLCVSVFFICLYVLYAIFFSNTLITWIMLIYVISAAIDINWFFFGLEQFKTTTIRSSVVKILSTILVFIFVKSPSDVNIYAGIMAVGILIGQVVLWPYLRKFVDIERVSRKNVLAHLKPNLVLFIPVIAISLYKMMDKIMLGAMSDLEQVGFYENAEKIIQVPLALVTSLGTVMMPKVANLVAKKDHEKNKKYIEKSLYFVACVSSFLCFTIIGLARDFVPWYYGDDFMPCVVLFYILMPSCIFLAVANVIRTQHLIPYKYDTIYIASVVFGAITNLVINSILIPRIGANGAAVGTLIAEMCVCLMQLFLIRKKLHVGRILFRSGWFVIIGAIVCVLLLFMPNVFEFDVLNLLFKFMVGLGVYILLSLPFVRKMYFVSGKKY